MEDVTYEIDDNEIDDMQHFPGFGKVAAYEMTSGKGKVINIGVFAHKLEDNEAFLDFYDEEILPRALD
jgi:acetoin utilization deacetylase AcuC-like enzyme